MDWSLVEHYGTCAKLVRSRARVLSTTDLVLAGFAHRDGLILLTTDNDFEALPEIKTENWTATQ